MSSTFAVLVGAIINTVVGMIWYGPLFGKVWMKLVGITKRDMKKAQKGMWKRYLTAFIAAGIMSYILGIFVIWTEAITWQAGAVLGFLMWLGFLATTMLNVVLWENKSIKLYVINASMYLVSLTIIGAVLAVMI